MAKGRRRGTPSHNLPVVLRRGSSTDRFVGSKIREHRLNLGWTQEVLGRKLGIAPQQVHKYEHGTNRVSAGRLHQLAEALDTPVESFFEGVTTLPVLADQRSQRLRLELSRNFALLSAQQQAAVAQLTRSLVAIGEPVQTQTAIATAYRPT